MKLLPIVITISLFFPAIGFCQPSANLPIKSVQPLQAIVYDETGTASLQNVCTVSSINEKLHYWLTAYHCIEDTTYTYYIAGQSITAVMKDTVNDLAIVSTPVFSAPAIKLSKVAPQLLDPVTTIGHPLGQIYPVVTVGTVAAENSIINGLPNTYIMFQVPSGPGGSGSPILNQAGEIISVVEAGPSRSFSPVMAGCLFDKLEALALWWEK